MQKIFNLSTLMLFISLIFIGIGDSFLPEPLGSLSGQTRGGINQALMGLFPDEKPINPSEKTDRLLKEAQEQDK